MIEAPRFMRENIVDIIAYLMAELHSNHAINEKTVATLSNQGYSQTEISTAFSWLADRASMKEFTSVSKDGGRYSFRILHDFEKMFVSSDVFGYLLLLQQLGILANDQLEEVIERCIATGQQPIELSDVKEIIAALLFSTDPYSAPGRRIFLHPTDMIQ
jgi:uncharacterized protein Smg (DUF494 family)